MGKVAIVTDSNSGITQQMAKELGIHVLPMPFTINDVEYYEDVNLTQDEFYKMLEEGTDIATSQPSVGEVMDLWDKLLEEYEEIVYIPMSSGLSGSCGTAVALASDYDGKVQVVDNKRISDTLKQSALDAKKLAEEGKSAAEIREILEKESYQATIYITVDTLKYLKKGGRVTAAGAAIGTVLNIKPVLTIQGDKLDAFAKVRGLKFAKKTMMDAIVKDINNRFSEELENNQLKLAVVHTKNQELAEELYQELKEIYPNLPISIEVLSLSVACHIGPGALAIACSKIL